jgi:phosphoglycerol transferase MdoB-like AlkP superfamily enzyme
MVVSGQEITPCLNRLTQTSLWGAAVDQTAQARSADCEFLLLNSLHLPSRGPLCYHFQDTRFRAIPHLLAEQGYHTWKAMPFSSDYWNARVMSAAYGFESQYYDETFRIEKPSEKVGWSLSDSALFKDLITLLTTMPQPFAGYVTTTMMHHPFRELTLEQEMLKLPQELRNTMLGDYLQLARFRDAAVGELVETMKLEGLWETTVLVLCGDHRSRLPAEEYQRLSIPYGSPDGNRVLLLIHLPGDRLTGELPTPLGQLDVAPTLVQLFGLADSPRAFLGRNLLSPSRPVVTRTGLLRPLGDHLEAKALESDPAADPSGQWREELAISDHLIRGDRIKDHLRPDP